MGASEVSSYFGIEFVVFFFVGNFGYGLTSASAYLLGLWGRVNFVFGPFTLGVGRGQRVLCQRATGAYLYIKGFGTTG